LLRSETVRGAPLVWIVKPGIGCDIGIFVRLCDSRDASQLDMRNSHSRGICCMRVDALVVTVNAARAIGNLQTTMVD
jgi:hypothetical protein